MIDEIQGVTLDVEKDGWYLHKAGNHSKYRHPVKPGQLTVPNHRERFLQALQTGF